MLVGLLLVTRGGSLLKHTLGVLLLAWRRIMLASAAAVIAGILIGETGAVIVTREVPPPLMAHIVVLILAAVLGYSTALTVFLDEIIQGLVNTIRMVEGDAAAGARAAAVIAEREAGEAGSGLMRFFGRRQPPPPPTDTTARAFVAPTVESTRSSEAQETESDFEATEAFVTTSPRPRVDARPVRADQLPRIGWAASGPQSAPLADYEAGAPADDGSNLGLALPDAAPLAPADVQDDRSASAPATSTRESLVSSAPVADPEPEPSISAQRAQILTPIPVRTADAAPTAEASPVSVDVAPTTTPLDASVNEPAATSPASTPPPSGDQWTPPSAVTVLPPGAAPEGEDGGEFGEAARPTRPLRPSRPLESDSASSSRRGIWSRISQALVGNTSSPSTPLAPDASAPAADQDAPTA